MATIKSYSDLQQSKKLAEILPLESADMHYVLIDTDEDKYAVGLGKYIGILPHCPCWSLASLLEIIPYGQVGRMIHNNKWEASSWNETDFDPILAIENFDNPIDACVTIIELLHELKML